MKNLINMVKAHREAGDVQRLHTVPVVGDASVAKHSWNMAMILWLLHPSPSLKLIMQALTHDNCERWTGDIPAPAKYRMFPALGAEMKAAEIKVADALGLDFTLSDEDQKWVRAADLLEFLMYCEDQLAMGNENMRRSLDNVRRHLTESDWIPEKIRVFAYAYQWFRTSDVVEGEHFGVLEDHT